MDPLVDDLHNFLINAPTSWHAALEIERRLTSNDFIPLLPDEKWKLKPGEKYLIIQEGTLATFVLPKKKPEKAFLICTHTDSPALKLKPFGAKVDHGLEQLHVEVYGSPLLTSWVNRDLALAGKVIVLNKSNKIERHFVFLEDHPAIIPLLAPHLDREGYKKGLTLNPQENLIAIAGLSEKEIDTSYIEHLLHQYFSFSKLIDFDLFLVPFEPPRFIGKDKELLASYRLDNLASVHAAYAAMASIDNPFETSIPIALFWDHEEIGSATHIGAQSPFFQNLMSRICDSYKVSREEELIIGNRSLCLSIDLTHAYNPNYPNKTEPNHTPLLGKGVTMKTHAGSRYATSSRTSCLVKQLCEDLHLPLQSFVSRSDNPPGSTVGHLFATQTGIETSDIGIPQLSMHASREIIACSDHIDMCTLLSHFFQRAKG